MSRTIGVGTFEGVPCELRMSEWASTIEARWMVMAHVAGCVAMQWTIDHEAWELVPRRARWPMWCAEVEALLRRARETTWHSDDVDLAIREPNVLRLPLRAKSPER